jgi:DNA-binding NarL/FixJ family response regulator
MRSKAQNDKPAGNTRVAVARLMAKGLSQVEIADALGIS